MSTKWIYRNGSKKHHQFNILLPFQTYFPVILWIRTDVTSRSPGGTSQESLRQACWKLLNEMWVQNVPTWHGFSRVEILSTRTFLEICWPTWKDSKFVNRKVRSRKNRSRFSLWLGWSTTKLFEKELVIQFGHTNLTRKKSSSSSSLIIFGTFCFSFANDPQKRHGND